jgi:adenylate cyclase
VAGIALIPEQDRGSLAVLGWAGAGALPLIGLVSLLARSQLDPGWESPRLHFVLFLTVGATAAVLASVAGDAARRRGDARVLLLSLAFLATGGFMALHAVGTEGVLATHEYAGFKVAIPVGLLAASGFIVAAAFVDLRPAFAGAVVRHRGTLRMLVLAAMALWTAWTLAELPPLRHPDSEGGAGSGLALLAVAGVAVYGVAAARLWLAFRGRLTLLPAAVIACCVLLAEAMIGVATTGERSWHASWWEWHGLIVLAYGIIGFAASREWREERFRPLYLETTRERPLELSVLFCDLAGFTAFSERSTPQDVAAMLDAFYGAATTAVRRFGGEVERLTGDGMLASFNRNGDRADHALRAARAALALQHEAQRLADAHPGWPRPRIGVNTGPAVIREMGGDGFVAYELVGDAVNVAARLEGLAPVGGVLIGEETRSRLPADADAVPQPGLRVKGKAEPVCAHVLRRLP